MGVVLLHNVPSSLLVATSATSAATSAASVVIIISTSGHVVIILLVLLLLLHTALPGIVASLIVLLELWFNISKTFHEGVHEWVHFSVILLLLFLFDLFWGQPHFNS